MEINIILGVSIDTLLWVEILREQGKQCIMVLDYDLTTDVNSINNITYISPRYAEKLSRENNSIMFYSSIYIYPGMYKQS